MTNNHFNLETVAYHITPVCSHRCKFCYNSNPICRATEHPDINTLNKITDRLADGGVKKFMLVGGDPASLPNISEFVKHSASRGIENVILSNTHEYETGIKSVAKYVSAFETTIHGPTSLLHDRIARKAGAYRMAVNNLKTIKSINGQFGMVYNLNATTLEYFYNSVKNLVKNEKLQPDYIGLQRIFPMPHIKNFDFAPDAMNPEKIVQLFNVIESIESDFSVPVEIWDTYPIDLVPEKHLHMIAPNDWGITIGAADHLGNIYRDGCMVSSRAGVSEQYASGNVFKQSVREIWNNAPNLIEFRNHSNLPEKCQKCPKLTNCGGGCISPKGSLDWDYLSQYCSGR